MAGSSPKIPIEIVSDEEIVAIEAALASAACSSHPTPAAVSPLFSPSSAPHLPSNTKSVESVSVKAKRRSSMCAERDIEDYGNLFTKKKKKRVADTLLDRFRSKRGLFVTDVSKTEWCEKQMEFSLFFDEEWKNNNEGKRAGDEESFGLVYGGRGRKNNEAYQAKRTGRDRHVELRNEVLEPVRVEVKSDEDRMALKLVNFINGVNQLMFEGLTRELPIVSFSFAEGIWMTGYIDEVRMPRNQNPILVETKTRFRDTVPAEPQKRNGRIQLMCYKYLWDNLVANHFPCREFYDYFGLNPQRTLCKDLQKVTADSGFSASNLRDVVVSYQNTCKMLPRAHNQLVLRYESQRDKSLLDEDKFAYHGGWLKHQIRKCLELWLGQREASFVAEEEGWKCGHCEFASECPAAYTDDTNESTEDEDEDLSSDDSSCYYY